MKKNDYFLLTTAQQRTILEQTATKQSLPKQAIEKDLWVSTILQIVFGLPCADCLVFKGGTSLSKVWKLINRFSEDIDLAIDRSVFGLGGNLTKKQVKSLRKASSLFVRDTLYQQLVEAINQTVLKDMCQVEPESDGDGSITLVYPEPRSIYIKYNSVFHDKLNYILPVVKIEVGARSLLEPNVKTTITSIVEGTLPTISTSIANVVVKAATAEKTFLEKAFLLHELFSVSEDVAANRRSRHMYDLYMMMEKGIADKAIQKDELWETIRQLRSMLTSVSGVDYTQEIRNNIHLLPPEKCITNWLDDYDEMKDAMIYNNPPEFLLIVDSMGRLENMFREHVTKNGRI